VVSDDNLSSCLKDMVRLCVTNRTVQGVKKLSYRPPKRLPLILKLITYNSIVLLVRITAVSCLAYWSVRQSTRSLCLLQISVIHVQLLRYYEINFGTSQINITLKFTKPWDKRFGNLRVHFCHATIWFTIALSS
jgi:hypothetical protein